MTEIYLPIENYRRAVDAIAAMTGVDPDEIKIALGEEGDIWPMSIQGPPEMRTTQFVIGPQQEALASALY